MKFDLKRLFFLNNLATALLPIVGIGIVSILVVKSHVTADYDRSSAILARSISGQITTYLREPIGTFNLLGNHLRGHDYSPAERGALLNLLVNSYEYFDAMYLLDRRGTVRQAGLKKERTSMQADILGMDFSGVEICREALKSGTLKWAPSLSIVTGEPTMSFCASLDGDTVLTELRLSDLGKIINESSSTRTFEAFIVDKSGRIIAHPDQALINARENIANLHIFREALAGRLETENFFLHGSELRGTALLIPELGWVLVVAQDIHEAMSPVHTLIYILSVGLVATILLALGLGHIGSRMLRRPFTELKEVAQRVINEDYAAVKRVESGCEEIRILSDTICSMVAAICARQDTLNEQTEELMATEESLRELNALLEEKVAERTARLEMVSEAVSALSLDLMQRTSSLEEANRQLESFAYTVSHDLRAPLRHAGSFASILLEEHAAGLGEEGSELARRIVASCGQMEQLIGALLEFSRVALRPINRTLVHPEKLVAEVLAELQGDLQGRSCEIIVAELPDCMADVILLRQVWANLLGNAIKYTRKTAAARIEVGAVRGGDSITYFVKDNGAGFDMAEYDRLFGVFQRLHSPMDFTGSGVGLAIVANIIKRHGGRIWALSKVGEGAEFRFSLPVAPAGTPASDGKGSAVDTPQPQRV